MERVCGRALVVGEDVALSGDGACRSHHRIVGCTSFDTQIVRFLVVPNARVGSVPRSTNQPSPAPEPSTRTNKHPGQNRSRGRRAGGYSRKRHEDRLTNPDPSR